MTWPLVSRRAYDLLVHDKQRLEAQVDKLIDDMTRQRRVEVGMPEVPRPERKKLEPMPWELTQHIKGWLGAQTQKLQRNQALKRHAQGESWADIMADLMREHDDEGLNLAIDEESTSDQNYDPPSDQNEESPSTPVDNHGQ